MRPGAIYFEPFAATDILQMLHHLEGITDYSIICAHLDHLVSSMRGFYQELREIALGLYVQGAAWLRCWSGAVSGQGHSKMHVRGAFVGLPFCQVMLGFDF